MNPRREERSTFRFPSKLRWASPILWAAIFALALLLPMDWNGCGIFRHGAVELLHFGFVFSWLLIFFALRWKWRWLLLVVTAPLVFYSQGLNGPIEQNAGPEAASVATLRGFQSSLNAYHNEHPQQGYPELLPAMAISSYAKFYMFNYVPGRDQDGKIVSYLVQATPRRSECGFKMSFTIAEDGKVFYTDKPKAATPADQLLE